MVCGVVLLVLGLLRSAFGDGADHHHHEAAVQDTYSPNAIDGGDHHHHEPPVQNTYQAVSANSVNGRQGGSHKMDQQFLYLLSLIPGKIDAAVSSISSDLADGNLKTQSFGWGLLAGGAKDILADFIGESRVLSDVITMPDVVYKYGYSVGYGFGFGGPFLLPTYLNDPNLDCSSSDFVGVVRRYGIQNGVSNGITTETRLKCFGMDAKVALHCLTQHAGDYKEAAEVEYLIDDLVEAGIQRLGLEGL